MRLLFLCVWFLTSLVASADVQLRNVSLQYGTSPRMLQRSWAFFNYRLVNDEDEAATVEVVLKPVDQRNVTIYAKTVTVPARSDLRARMLVTIGTVEEYEATLLRDGNAQGAGEDVIIRLGSPSNRMVYFVNDELDLEYGNFAKNDELNGRYKTTFVRAEKTPEFWAGYDHVHMLVLMRPDFRAMTERQMDAIVDFAARGGTVVFDDPHGIMEASQTRLGELLNVQPLGIRPLERLTALEALGGSTIEWPEGEAFLESRPIGDGITMLEQDGMPVLRWSRYGLGMVGCVTINPSQQGFRQPESNFNTIWNHMLSYGGRSPWPSTEADANVVDALNELTGIEIPSRTFVRNLVLTYLIVIILVIVAGRVTRRQLTAWLGLAGLSIVTTIGLFIYSQVLAKDLPEQTATLMRFQTWGTDRTSGDQITSLMIKSEASMDITCPDQTVILRSLVPDLSRRGAKPEDMSAGTPDGPPGSGRYVDKGKDEVLTDPIRIDEENGVREVRNMMLQPKSPKMFAALYSTEDIGAGDVDLPQVAWTPNGPTLTPWKVPAELSADGQDAILVGEAGFTQLVVENGMIRSRRGTSIMSPRADVAALQRFLDGIATPGPMLALFSPATEGGAGLLPDGFRVVGRVVTLIPVRQDLAGEALHLPGERIRLDAERGGGPGSQGLMAMPSGQLAPASPIVGRPGPEGKNVDVPRSFRFRAHLPPGFNRMELTAAQVHWEADNRGGNIRFEIFLRPWDATDDQRDIPVSRTENDIYYFEDLPEGMVDPVTGSTLVIIREHQKSVYANRSAAMRPNSWVVKEINLAVAGRLPDETTGQL